MFEVIWTDTRSYAGLRESVTAEFVRGALVAPGVAVNDVLPARAARGSAGGPELPPAVSARYERLEELGRGGMGMVYRVRDRETGDVVALKLIKPEIAAHPELLERFKSELRLARKITHKNVCRAYELLRFDATAVIAMEYVEGEDLRSVLDRFAPLSVQRGLELLQGICEGVRAAHAQGTIHRDLKPQNIMVDRGGEARVMDFGIAALAGPGEAAAAEVVGTPHYMSPEQAEGRGADARSDIYALGILMYEMFTGALPFSGENARAVLLQQIRQVPRSPKFHNPYLPERLERVILRCLEKNPARRYQTVEELLAALFEHPRAAASAESHSRALGEPVLLLWQRWDSVQLLGAAAGLLAVALLFPLVSPLAGIRLNFDRETAARMTNDWARQFGLQDYQVAYVGFRPAYGEDPAGEVPVLQTYWAEHLGAVEAPPLQASQTAFLYWTGILARPGSRDPIAQCMFDPAGKLLTWHVRLAVTNPARSEASEEELRPRAEGALREHFAVQPEKLEAQPVSREPRERNLVTTFTWLAAPDRSGGRLRYQAGFAGEQLYLLDRAVLLPTHKAPSAPDWFVHTAFTGAVLLAIVVLFFARRIFLHANYRRSGAVAALAGAAWAWWMLRDLYAYEYYREPVIVGAAWEAGEEPTAYIVLFLLSVFVCFALVSAAEHYLSRNWQEKIATYLDLAAGRWREPPVALSVIRGACWGLALLGLFYTAAWLAGRAQWVVLPITYYGWVLTQAGPALVAVCLAVSSAVVAGFGLVALPVAMLRRVVRRRFWLVLAGTLVWTASLYNIEPDPVSPNGAVVLHLFLWAALFSLAFVRYDLLTLLVALLTYYWLDFAYAFLQVHWNAGSAPYWAMLGAWAIVLAAALAVYFQQALVGAVRSLRPLVD